MGPTFGRPSDVPSAPFDKSHDLRDIDFWLNRFFKTEAYCTLKYNVVHGRVHWRLGVGPTFSFTRVLSSILQEGTAKFHGPFDLVIKVDLNEAPKRRSLGVTHKLAIGIADKLGLLGLEYSRIKEDYDELQYYSYGFLEDDVHRSMEQHIESIVPQIFQNLSTKRYLLIVDNLLETIEPNSFTEKVGLPPPSWKGSIWLLMPTILQGDDDEGGWSEQSQSQPGRVAVAFGKGGVSFTEDEILMLILSSLHQAAKDIYSIIRYKDEQYWHLISLRCFHYAMLFFPQCSPPLDDDEDHQSSNNALVTITSDELIRQWAAQEIFTVIHRGVQEITKETNDFLRKYNDYYDIHQVGRVILEVFRDCSLLELPFSPETKADEATKTAAHFLAHRGLIAERLTTDDFCDDDGPGQENIQWISQGGDQGQGFHISRDWLCQGTSSGPSALILRQCSQQSSLLAKLDHILVNLPYLRVLDLSYTPLGLLPPSICCLQKLQLLSLRGCYNLTSPFSFPKAKVTPSENDTGNKIPLLYLDLSSSNINTFHSGFFHNMPNLQELVLVKCSNLVELPLSIVVLSSLEILEVTETQIKSFHGEGFKNLRSLKLIGNKKLLSLSGPVSDARGLIDQRSKEWESCVQKEITLEGHPTLRSFTLIDAPLIRRLSLCRCRNLDSVDIKEVDALEELDLSGTSIKELPAGIPNLPKLRQLFIMDVPSLRRFPWHELQRLPDVFRLGHSYIINGDNSNHQQVAQVCVSDCRILYGFARSMDSRSREVLKSFYIRVVPCNRGTANMMDAEEDIVSTDKIQVSASAYADVNCHYVSLVSQDVKPPFVETERHMEISAVGGYHPEGLGEALDVTKSIRLAYDDQFPSLNKYIFDLEQLEYCSLLQCHLMVHVFKEWYAPPRSLKSACVSYLRSLSYFDKTFANEQPSWAFNALRHLRLDHCPRLEGLMPCVSTLSSLETLDVLFCYNVKVLFYDNLGQNGPYELPSLRRIRLQELPLLERLRVDDAILTAPVWEELHVRGCWSLRDLPRLRHRSGKVKVSGERTWWAKLRREQDDGEAAPHHSSYEPRLPRAVASMRDRVVIKSYLR